jgi:hypothetical protein
MINCLEPLQHQANYCDKPKQAENREELKELLKVGSG